MKYLNKHLLIVTLIMISANINATVIYNEETSFLDALNISIIDDYENPAYRDISIFGSDIEVTEVLNQTAYTSTAHFDSSTTVNFNGDHYYCAGCNGTFLLDFTNTSVSDSNGVYGVGFDFINSEDPFYSMFVTYGDGSTENVALDQTLPFDFTFFGFTSDLSISSIHFGLEDAGTTFYGYFGLDNLIIGNSDNSVSPVPEPTTLLLALLGILCMRFKQ